jgi:hypothetical protein
MENGNSMRWLDDSAWIPKTLLKSKQIIVQINEKNVWPFLVQRSVLQSRHNALWRHFIYSKN